MGPDKNPVDDYRIRVADLPTLRLRTKERIFTVIALLFRTRKQWAVRKPLPPLLFVARQAGFMEESFKACLARGAIGAGSRGQEVQC